jgi:TATA-box binding protein (TBP) (component of TFIID and TFIIIB)
MSVLCNYVCNDLSINNVEEINLPKNVTISTMSCTCKLGVLIKLENIDKFMKLTEEDIITIKYNGKVRSLDKNVLKKRKKKKKTTKNFFNQLTTEIRPSTHKKINVKIFKNGSLQMTGCKSINDCNTVLNHLINRLKKVYAQIENNKIVEYPFIEDINDIKNINVRKFKIDMINSNFDIGYKINREILYNLLLKDKVTCRYEPCIHACVNIKFQPENQPHLDGNSNSSKDGPKKVSIFVFQSGNIIITGAKNEEQIMESYKYINNILLINKDKIERKEIKEMFDDDEFSELLVTNYKDNKNSSKKLNIKVI